MPWVNLFEVFPDAEFVDSETGNPVNVVDGRVVHEFPDTGGSGFMSVTYYPNEVQNVRVRFVDIVAVAAADGTLGSEAGIYDANTEERSFANPADGLAEYEPDPIPWAEMYVSAMRNLG